MSRMRRGGDVIDFLMKLETLSFIEAVERLAHRAGLELRYERGRRGSGGPGATSRLVAAHVEAAESITRSWSTRRRATPAAT